jgi:hypothetical protein
MTGFTDRTAQAVLNHLVGKTAIFAMPQAFVALFTAVGADSGLGFTEVVGGGYARTSTVAGDWNSASGSSPSQITNANPIVFPAATSAWTGIMAFGLYDALTGGNLIAWDYFGNFQWRPTTIAVGSPAVFTQPQHGYLAGDNVMFTTEYGGLLPTGGSLSGLLTVQSPTTDTFNVSVNMTGSGEGMVRKVLTQTVQSSIQPLFAAGSLAIAAS